MYNPFSLIGKKILVTGASSGIGRECAVECSRMGAEVVITARNSQRLQETYERLEGSNHTQVVADLTDTDAVMQLVASLPELQGVVLCAGRGLTLPFLFSDRSKFNTVFDINFFSPIELLRLIVKKKKITKDSSVVVITSCGGVRHVNVGNDIYDASKAALHSMVRSCAMELAPKKIRVNDVCPAMVETPLIHDGIQITPEQLEEDKKRYPLKRYGLPKDVALGVIYLLSDASSWVTGQSLVIDGGITI